MRTQIVFAVVAIGTVAFLVWRFLGPQAERIQAGAALVQVNVPTLTAEASAGKAVFDAKCAVCHGPNAAGVDGAGPPLVHIIYEPNHHADAAFYLAVKQGVRAHHWRFGNMPPMPGVVEQDVAKIIAYVRELQRANGID